MKYTVRTLETEKFSPNVGDAWTHKHINDNVYIRIPDTAGEKLFPNLKKKDIFYSVCLDNGNIVWSYKDNECIICKDAQFNF